MHINVLDIISIRFHPKIHKSEYENRIIADILVKYLESSNMKIVMYSLNTIFDVYSEEIFDYIFVEKNL